MNPDQNVALHRQVIAAACEGRVPESLLAADFRMEHHTCSMTARSYRGPAGWRDWNRDLFEEFCCDAQLEVETILAAEQDFVVAAMCLSGTSVHARTPIRFRWTEVTWFSDSTVTRAIGFPTPEEALMAAQRGPQAPGRLARRPHRTAARADGAVPPSSDGHPIGEHPQPLDPRPAPRRAPARRRFTGGRLGIRPAGAHAQSASSRRRPRLSWA